MKREYYLHYFNIFLLGCLLACVVKIALLIPIHEKEKFHFLFDNHPILFLLWMFLGIGSSLITGIISFSPTIIEMREPFSQTGVYLFTLVVLLTSNFFVYTGGTNYSTLFEARPVIFITSIYLIVMTVLTSIGVNIKVYRQFKEKSNDSRQK